MLKTFQPFEASDLRSSVVVGGVASPSDRKTALSAKAPYTALRPYFRNELPLYRALSRAVIMC
jgi:hypothetical protein